MVNIKWSRENDFVEMHDGLLGWKKGKAFIEDVPLKQWKRIGYVPQAHKR